ncbi:hypothetical protein [Planococcus halotolerans]|uniref:hypothetical protein n=1 Tax=Planococcus halotolerans TaxID=2233542 RepID=UPI001091CB76|nr:hypothetical protein [Planococcus halotolerans]QHJ69214.1 hypothetical protein DNR44_000520 [Planococcus halotolerans]
MINPFESLLFNSSYDIDDRKFKNKELILTLILHRRTIIVQYLIFKLNDSNNYLILGFDFEKETVIPVEKESINVILNKLSDLISSEYNTIDLSIDNIPEANDYYRKLNIKKTDFYSYKNITFLSSKGRSVISCECEAFNNQIMHKPTNSILFFNRSGLLYGKIEVEINQKNIEDIKKIHLVDDMIIRYLITEERIETAGRIYEAATTGFNTYELTISSFMHELVYIKGGYYSSQGLNLQSHVNAILRTAGIKKEQINIESVKEIKAPYLVIIPIVDLSITSGSFGLGDVSFYSKEQVLFKYKNMSELYKHDLHEKFQTFAQTIVESDNTYDAYQLGLLKVQSALDVIMLLAKNDRAFNLYNLGHEFNKWNRLGIYQNPTCSTFYYVENMIGSEKIFSDSKNIRAKNSLLIDSTLDKQLKELEWYEEKLYEKLTNQQSPILKQIFNAIKWLNRSWKATDIEDKVIYTNISMEFLVDKVKTEPFLPKEIVTEFKQDIKLLLKDKDIYTEEYEGKIKEKSLGNLSNPPLKVKVQSLINQLKIPITADEFDKLWEVRSYRNDLIHGRSDLEINAENVLLANIVMGELISYRLRYEDGV